MMSSNHTASWVIQDQDEDFRARSRFTAESTGDPRNNTNRINAGKDAIAVCVGKYRR